MKGYLVPPRSPGGNNLESYRRHSMQLAEAVALLMGGKCNAVRETTFTLTAAASSTTLSDARITVNSEITLKPLTANAAQAKQYLSIPAATILKGSAVIQHNEGREPWLFAQTDLTYRVMVIG